MSHLLNSTTDINLRAKKLRADEIEVFDPVTNEFVPVVPGGGSDDTEVPPYAQPTLIDFGEKRMKINQSHLEVGDVGSAMRKTEVKASGLDVTDDAGNNAKIEGGAIYYKKASLEGEEENPTVTMPYEDIAEVVDKIKPIEYLENTEIFFQPVNSVYSKIKNNSVKIGTGSNTNSATNNTTLAYEGLYITGSSGNTTVYRNGEIRRALASVTKTLNIANIADSQTNYLKPDKIEFADGSGMSEGTLHYRDGEGLLKQKSILSIVEDSGALPNYIKNDSIQFNDDSDPGFSRIEQDVIGTNTFSAEDFGGTSTLYGPTEILRRESGVNKTTNVNDVIDVTNKFKDVTAAAGTINSIHNRFAAAASAANLTSTNIRDSLLKMKDISVSAADINNVTNNLKDLTSTAAQIDAAVTNSGGTTYPYLKSKHIELSAEDGGPYPITVNMTGSSLLTRISNESIHVINPGNGSSSALYPSKVQINRTGGGYTALSSTSIDYKDSSSEPIKWADVSDVIDVANDFKNVSADYLYPMKTYDILFNGSTTAKSGYTTCGPAAEGVTALYPMMNIMALYAFQSMNNDIAFNFEGRVMLSGNYAFTGTAGVNKQRTYSFEVTVPGVHLPKFTLDQIILGDDTDNSSSPSGRVYQNLMVRHVNMPTFQRFEGITNSVWKFSFQLYNSSSSNIEVGHMLMRFRLILHIKERLDGSGMIEV